MEVDDDDYFDFPFPAASHGASIRHDAELQDTRQVSVDDDDDTRLGEVDNDDYSSSRHEVGARRKPEVASSDVLVARGAEEQGEWMVEHWVVGDTGQDSRIPVEVDGMGQMA